ncbi:lactococcin A1 precursor [Clostridium grantii]|uniref:Bacteriocin class II with double-glycine leader peptide n=1 Tax=Clostridium grantii DSM 8605 TaxID=1121316 RepID=A0A1M5Y8C4_9CLOT|nr:lactococcin A1 precursor [Clostridium grantii]SHI08317.1 hypothetical protein SAMN02745207_04280 [Clostridium grantii DSM 8605]
MEMTLNYSGAFCELGCDELEGVNGGVDWNGVGLGVSMTAGGIIGAKIGALGGVPGVAAGTIIGAAVGGILYSLWD